MSLAVIHLTLLQRTLGQLKLQGTLSNFPSWALSYLFLLVCSELYFGHWDGKEVVTMEARFWQT